MIQRITSSSSTKRKFIAAATSSASDMLAAFESKLSQFKDVETTTNVECSNTLGLTSEQEDLLWAIDDRYEGDVADEDIPAIIEQVKQDIMSELGVDERTARRAMIDILGYNPDDIKIPLNSSTKVTASHDLPVLHEDGYVNYIDTDGIYTGIPGANISLAEMKNYWNDFYDDDPVLNEEYGPEEGERWLSETLSHMQEIVEDCDSVMSATEVKANDSKYQPFMLMEYSSGGPETGIEGDDFYCWGKFFAVDEADAKRQLERAKRKYGRDWDFQDVYVSEYNDYFDDGDEVCSDLDCIIQKGIASRDSDGNMPEEPVFESTQVKASNIMDGEEVAEPVECGLFSDYFGKEQAEKYGDLIAENLSGKTVSKRKDLAEQPGGLIYEAEQLGIDMWDLLEALEGMCYQGRASEIDDSTYKVK